MKNSFLDMYEAELLVLVPTRVIPRKQPQKLRELLAKIERIAKNQGMDLTTYLIILGFRYEDEIKKELKRKERPNPHKGELLKIYPHKKVYALAKKSPSLWHKFTYHIRKTPKKQTINQYIGSLGYTVITGRTLTKLLLALDAIATHRVLVYLPLNLAVNDLMKQYLKKQGDMSVEDFMLMYKYKLYEKLTLRDLENFTLDMLADIIRKAYPQGVITNISDIPPAIPSKVLLLSEKEHRTFSEWLQQQGFHV